MVESTSSELREPGAPVAPGQIDPDLVKLARSRPRVGVITAAGIVALCIAYLIRLAPDRRFGGASAVPRPTTAADIAAGKVDPDQLVALAVEPVVGQALRATKAPGALGLRLAPVRGTADRVWIATSGDGWQAPPGPAGYIGRLRKLDDLAFADAARSYTASHPQPVFATAAALHAGTATGTVVTVAGDPIAPADGDRVVLEVVDPEAVRRQAAGPAPGAAPATQHYETTWGALSRSSPSHDEHGAPAGGLHIAGRFLPDAQIDLVGIYVARAVPAGAYAVVTGELPDDYWYVMPITISLVLIALVFGWALIRAIRRDLGPARDA
jgi:hypothetical protein